jgi:hypothetical protein
MAWSANNGREDCAWSVVTSESSLAHTGTIVNDQGSYFIVIHVCRLVGSDSVTRKKIL